MKQARSVILHFFAWEKLNGFVGSSGPSHVRLPVSESDAGADSFGGSSVLTGIDITKGSRYGEGAKLFGAKGREGMIWRSRSKKG